MAAEMENKVVEGIVEDTVEVAAETVAENATNSGDSVNWVDIVVIGALAGAGAMVGSKLVNFVGGKVVDPLVDKWAAWKQRRLEKKAAKKAEKSEETEE